MIVLANKHIDSNESKKKIIELFNEKVKGKKPDTHKSNKKHDGKGGHWLETQMGIPHNADNHPDIFGYEMKNETTSKTTFGDWSASFYIFKDKNFDITRDDFIKIFGKPNFKKGGRCSWSGEPIPKINKYSKFGQILLVDEEENILIKYNYDKDLRQNKSEIVPSNMQKTDLIIAKWDKQSLKPKLEKKFNGFGWFKCKKDNNGFYNKIVFGDPINWVNWIKGVNSGLIFFDSGMYVGNNRPYSEWRANNEYWDSLIREEY